ncbi:MAG TPA: SIS domain-containing protein [Spongiibacteraceae bacterium]|nr:SIS domain-containing protein [Spongiibacteraceae bacterium]
MELTERVIDIFHRHIDSTMQAIEPLSPNIAIASEILVSTLLNDGKILCCGEGPSGLLSQYFASALLNRFQRERPGLPAIALNGDAALLTAIASDASFNEIFAKQIRALAQLQDTVVLISHGTGSGTALQTIQSAHDREVRVIVICGEEDSDIRALLGSEDIELRIEHTQRAQFLEMALLVLHSLCELIELQLFGSEV